MRGWGNHGRAGQNPPRRGHPCSTPLPNHPNLTFRLPATRLRVGRPPEGGRLGWRQEEVRTRFEEESSGREAGHDELGDGAGPG